MDVPLEIQFHNMDRSEAVETAIRKRVEKLAEFGERIISCRVTVDHAHKHHHQGNQFHVTVSAQLAGRTVVASRDPAAHHAHEDAYVAIRDAFKAVQRQVQDFKNVQSGKVKAHDVPMHGKIVTLDRNQGFGFIATPDGRECYFHRNSVLNSEVEVG